MPLVRDLVHFLPDKVQKVLPKLPEIGVEVTGKGGVGASIKENNVGANIDLAMIDFFTVKFSIGGNKNPIDIGGSNMSRDGTNIHTGASIDLGGQKLGGGTTQNLVTRYVTPDVTIASSLPGVSTNVSQRKINDSTSVITSKTSISYSAYLVLGGSAAIYITQRDTIRTK